MSGIVGIFRRDNTAVDPGDLGAMLRAIEHRGPDGRDIWCRGAIGLGNCLLVTTPEAWREKLPAVTLDGRLALCADARIDNRADLRRALDLHDPNATDSDFILCAYQKWGTACAAHLIGDFSFAIWDESNQNLFCARDSAGMRSFYYYAARDILIFASELKALFALRRLPQELNETRIGDYLINLYEDRESTFYRHILRLPAATTLTVTSHSLSKHLYWKLDPNRELRLKDDREYTEGFRELFDEAVRCRVRSSHPVGSALSGGLDSSAIACSARNLSPHKIHTFSIIFPGLPEQDLRVIDERKYMEAVLATGNFIPHFIHGDQLSPLHDAAQIHRALDEANCAPNLYLHWAMYEKAGQSGVRVFLDGLDGDTTVSHGFEYLEELGRRFHWLRLHRESALLAANLFGGSRARRVIWNYCVKDIAPVWMYQAWRLARGRFREVRENSTLLNPAFVNRMDLRNRARSMSPVRTRHTARGYHHKALTFSLYAHALEMADKTSASFGIECRYPFFDRRLIEFCLALPADQKLGQGWNRVIFRRAMEGVLPPEIQWRQNKGNLSPNFHRKLLEKDAGMIETAIAAGAAGEYLDTSLIQRAFAEYRRDPLAAGGKNPIQLFTAASLAIWLEQAKIGRVTHA
jgi:asparagine synthase (glutamine-hydrolysing)